MPIGSPQWMYNSGSEFTLDQSLRTDRASSTTLTKTFASAGNRRTWSFSVWFKRGNIGGVNNSGNKHTFFNGQDQDNFVRIADDCLQIYAYDGSTDYGWISTAVVRDTSAWYHALFVMDTTSGTASQRQRIYLNGVELTDKGTDYGEPPQDYEGFVNTATKHYVAGSYSSTGFDGYLAEMHFIDGTALTPSSFGETGDYGEWKPIEVSGLTYGTNGFYLPFKNDYTVEGFSAVTYKGNGGTQYIGGTGFQPDLTWIKPRSVSDNSVLFDAVRGYDRQLKSNGTDAEDTHDPQRIVVLSDGFEIDSTDQNYNSSSYTYVAWNWKAATQTSQSAPASDGLASVTRANTDAGFSIATWTGLGENNGNIVKHGLGGVPELIIVKWRNDTGGWYVWHKGLTSESYELYLQDTNAETAGGWMQHGSPTSTTFELYNGSSLNALNSLGVGYFFRSIDGYSKVGSYTGNAGDVATVDGYVTKGIFVYTGFQPAFLLIKSAVHTESWHIWDNKRWTRDGNPNQNALVPNTSAAEVGASTPYNIDFLSNGFKLRDDHDLSNGDGDTHIYLAFAETPFKYSNAR